MKLLIQPRKSIGPIALGMPRHEVRAVLSDIDCSLTHETKTLDYFFGSTIQVEYENDETASFIGVASQGNIELIYNNIDLFDMDAKSVFNCIASNEQDRNHVFTDSEYLFPDQIMTLWDADTQYDYKGKDSRSVWGQIGIGDERYLSEIKKIKKTEPDK